MLDFEPYPKVPRWKNLGMVITEKIDGTNAQVCIEPAPPGAINEPIPAGATLVHFADAENREPVFVRAASRKRWISAEDDNFGFARWVEHRAVDLARELGVGRHYGEWWGAGIQRRYRLDEKRFSLFNVYRWAREGQQRPAVCGVVPVLYWGEFSVGRLEFEMEQLRRNGSEARPGFDNPEGVMVYLPGARQMFKHTFDGPKWAT